MTSARYVIIAMIFAGFFGLVVGIAVQGQNLNEVVSERDQALAERNATVSYAATLRTRLAVEDTLLARACDALRDCSSVRAGTMSRF